MAKPKMREVIVKKLKKGVDGAHEDFDYKSTLCQILNLPIDRQKGATMSEMRSVSPVLDQLDEVEEDGAILLTESQWADLKSRIKNFPWAQNLRCIITFEDDIKTAKIVDMKPDKTKGKEKDK